MAAITSGLQRESREFCLEVAAITNGLPRGRERDEQTSNFRTRMETSGICKDIFNSLIHRSLSGAEHLKQNLCVLSSELCLGTEDTLTRYYGHHSNKVEKPFRPCVALEIENTNWKMLCNEVYDQAHELRQMKGEDLEGLNVEELEQLEKKLEAGLSLVIKNKEERTWNEINKLQREEVQLIKENKQLKQEMKMILHRGKLVTVNSELVNNVSIGSSSIPPLDDDSPYPPSSGGQTIRIGFLKMNT